MTHVPPSSAPAPGTRPLIAHIDPADSTRTEPLASHASNVRSTAARFGACFGRGATAAFAGGIDDFGKAAPDVQDYLWSFTGDCSEEDESNPALPGVRHGPDHSTAGARYAAYILPCLGLLLNYAKNVLRESNFMFLNNNRYSLYLRLRSGRRLLIQNNICELKHCLKA